MRNLINIFLYMVYAILMLMIFLIPANKYAWMSEMDKLIQLPEDASGNSLLFLSIMLSAALATQLFIFILTRVRLEKIIALILTGVAIIFYLIKSSSF